MSPGTEGNYLKEVDPNYPRHKLQPRLSISERSKRDTPHTDGGSGA